MFAASVAARRQGLAQQIEHHAGIDLAVGDAVDDHIGAVGAARLAQGAGKLHLHFIPVGVFREVCFHHPDIFFVAAGKAGAAQTDHDLRVRHGCIPEKLCSDPDLAQKSTMEIYIGIRFFQVVR